ncbi:hypothetical protein AURDEDRAFT_171089 [Auricularia subglabra TFB-10046 SS5]|nr:hypothetical protein AURDEDRAFT_171089 [Auricularia subglabra TFB-10046 SS5]
MPPTTPTKVTKGKRFTARMTTGSRPPRPQSAAAIINLRRAVRARYIGRFDVRTRSEHRQFEADCAQLKDEGYVYVSTFHTVDSVPYHPQDEETHSFVHTSPSIAGSVARDRPIQTVVCTIKKTSTKRVPLSDDDMVDHPSPAPQISQVPRVRVIDNQQIVHGDLKGTQRYTYARIACHRFSLNALTPYYWS